jgi:hypothetical protein
MLARLCGPAESARVAVPRGPWGRTGQVRFGLGLFIIWAESLWAKILDAAAAQWLVQFAHFTARAPVGRSYDARIRQGGRVSRIRYCADTDTAWIRIHVVLTNLDTYRIGYEYLVRVGRFGHGPWKENGPNSITWRTHCLPGSHRIYVLGRSSAPYRLLFPTLALPLWLVSRDLTAAVAIGQRRRSADGGQAVQLQAADDMHVNSVICVT